MVADPTKGQIPGILLIRKRKIVCISPKRFSSDIITTPPAFKKMKDVGPPAMNGNNSVSLTEKVILLPFPSPPRAYHFPGQT